MAEEAEGILAGVYDSELESESSEEDDVVRVVNNRFRCCCWEGESEKDFDALERRGVDNKSDDDGDTTGVYERSREESAWDVNGDNGDGGGSCEVTTGGTMGVPKGERPLPLLR